MSVVDAHHDEEHNKYFSSPEKVPENAGHADSFPNSHPASLLNRVIFWYHFPFQRGTEIYNKYYLLTKDMMPQRTLEDGFKKVWINWQKVLLSYCIDKTEWRMLWKTGNSSQGCKIPLTFG